MNILFFNASTNIGGIESVFLTYASGLSKKGQDVYYVSCWDKGDFENVLPDNVKFIGLGNIRLRYSVIRMWRILKEIGPDVIITANDSTLVAYLATFFQKKKIRIITSQHSYLDNSDTLFYSRIIVKHIFKRCDRIIAVSDGIAQMLSEKYRINQCQVLVLNNPIDLRRVNKMADEYSIEEDDGYFVFVGRMTSVKNLKFLIDSYNIYRSKYEKYSLVLIGDGPDRVVIEEYARTTCYTSSIRFIGVKSNPFPYIKGAKLLLLSSTSEAFPVVLIEALAMGVTCVSTPTKGGIDILENGRLGYLSKDSNDVEQFAETINMAVDEPLDKQKLAYAVDMRFGLDNKVNALLDIINSL